ncbi:MAG: HD domain-containing protein [Thiolinea sp.]
MKTGQVEADEQQLSGMLDFLRGAEELKNTLRSAHTSNGRQESTAEHTWRLCLMVMLFEKQYPHIDTLKLLKICIIHDLGEAVCGDVPAIDQVEGSDKGVEERKGFQQLLSPLAAEQQHEFLALWDEYENVASPEASLAKAFDKLETILQHTQGKNPPDFDYGFNLSYGKKYTDFDGMTAALRRLVDRDTQELKDAR